jgi:hypothetical protein
MDGEQLQGGPFVSTGVTGQLQGGPFVGGTYASTTTSAYTRSRVVNAGGAGGSAYARNRVVNAGGI